jgi:hypothetical protein
MGMIIYNVTINVEDDVNNEWRQWMQEVHIPEVMHTGMFVDFSFSRLLTRQEDETGTTYVIQYLCESMEKYEVYVQHFAPALQAKTQQKFGSKYIAFRTLMEKI